MEQKYSSFYLSTVWLRLVSLLGPYTAPFIQIGLIKKELKVINSNLKGFYYCENFAAIKIGHFCLPQNVCASG